MVKELLLRFVIGGIFVSTFAVIGDVLKPKRFAGLFGAAPSIALATLALTVASEGKLYAATEARSMIGGGIAFVVYAWCACQIIMRYKIYPLTVTLSLVPAWLAVSFGVWYAWLR